VTYVTCHKRATWRVPITLTILTDSRLQLSREAFAELDPTSHQSSLMDLLSNSTSVCLHQLQLEFWEKSVPTGIWMLTLWGARRYTISYPSTSTSEYKDWKRSDQYHNSFLIPKKVCPRCRCEEQHRERAA
jgi:hypothetical protein